MADKVLKEIISILSLTEDIKNELLDDLLEKRVLYQEVMEKVINENATVMDKARALIDPVIWIWAQKSKEYVDHIWEISSHLVEKLVLPSGNVYNSD
ncbi:PREDICTED: caspase-1-like [Myotis brandtii]|uniref:caspase-1-like n=1 Tax=Myotis brandtii TaxID=109478 RepID=UPI0003BB6F37|nr:PREDICTED: caspase-1-like [Myotis brandtii]